MSFSLKKPIAKIVTGSALLIATLAAGSRFLQPRKNGIRSATQIASVSVPREIVGVQPPTPGLTDDPSIFDPPAAVPTPKFREKKFSPPSPPASTSPSVAAVRPSSGFSLPLSGLAPIRPSPKTAEAPLFSRPLRPSAALFGFWWGAGFNFITFSENDSNLGSGDYATISAPATSAGLEAALFNAVSLAAEYHDRPSDIETDPAARVNASQYHWRTLLAEVRSRVAESDNEDWTVLAGVQIHQMPFLSLNPDQSVSLTDNQIQNLSLGVRYSRRLRHDYESEALLRYQHVLGSRAMGSSSFHASQRAMFDGSLGILKRFDRGWNCGLYWFGQEHDFTYTATRNGQPTSGSQSMFNSTFQIRFGWEFH